MRDVRDAMLIVFTVCICYVALGFVWAAAQDVSAVFVGTIIVAIIGASVTFLTAFVLQIKLNKRDRDTFINNQGVKNETKR